jgi:hypothetical protein
VERNNHGHTVLLWLRDYAPLVVRLKGLDGKPVHRIIFGKRLRGLGYPAFEAGKRQARHSGLTLRETGQSLAFGRATRDDDY